MSRRITISYTYHSIESSGSAAVRAGYNDYMRRYGTRISRGERYRKYAVIDVDDVHTVIKTKEVVEQPGRPIVSHMVQLGGPFEEVGGKDEIVGSTDQALGSDVK